MTGREPETEWRQGRALSPEAAKAISLVGEDHDDPIVIVITHDCDLVASSDVEPDCEVIVGRIIDKADGNFAHSRNPRKLHISLSAGSVPVVAEFLARDKRFVEKSTILGHPPSPTAILRNTELDTLRKWLAVRYDRAAVPDEFDRRSKEGAYKEFQRVIARTESYVLAVLIDLDGGEDIEREKESAYSLRIYLVYDVSEDPAAAHREVSGAAERIEAAFRKHYMEDGQWREIELEACQAVSEDSITLHDQRRLREWQFDYLSLREDA